MFFPLTTKISYIFPSFLRFPKTMTMLLNFSLNVTFPKETHSYASGPSLLIPHAFQQTIIISELLQQSLTGLLTFQHDAFQSTPHTMERSPSRMRRLITSLFSIKAFGDLLELVVTWLPWLGTLFYLLTNPTSISAQPYSFFTSLLRCHSLWEL